jgi:hypothetical protein
MAEVKSIASEYSNEEKEALEREEHSYHVKDILLSILLFVVFEFLVFLFQGKLPFFEVKKCSVLYPLGIVALILITAGYVYMLRLRFRKVFAIYRVYKIEQEIYLDGKKEFYYMIVGALAAGFVQGVLGVGCGTCIVMALLAFSMNTTAASATSAYQILFTGGASLLEFYLNG